jgi:hypothetical protein
MRVYCEFWVEYEDAYYSGSGARENFQKVSGYRPE